MRSCLFCLAPANSLEDAWPQWITKQFKGRRPSEVHAERGGKKLKPWRTLQPELTIRCVCRGCNNGWMSQLEQAAQPVLQPLIAGQSVSLDETGQAVVARWAVKTAMVLEAVDPREKRIYEAAQCARFRACGAIPWRTTIWLAASVDSASFMSTKNRHLGEPAHEIVGASTTMAFGHIAIQVLTMQVPEDVGPQTVVTTMVRRGPWDQLTRQVWSTRAPVTWPPAMGVSGEEGLDAFADRFSAVGHDGPIDTMAV